MAAEEVAQAGSPAPAAVPADHKRKLDDLNATVVAAEPEVSGGELRSDGLGVKDNGVEDGGEDAVHGFEGKRPRIDLEADASGIPTSPFFFLGNALRICFCCVRVFGSDT